MDLKARDLRKRVKMRHANNYLLKIARWMLINLEKSKLSDGSISINDMINLIASGAFYFVILVFAFPIALPLPYPPGFPSICGIPIFLLSIQLIFNKKVIILPKFVKQYRLKLDLIRLIIHKSNRILKFLSRFIKPRRLQVIVSERATILYGLLFFILSVCILIPFPGTNFIPAVGVFLSCLGLLFKDGLFGIVGAIVGIIGVFIVYFFSAMFATAISKFFKFTYYKISNLYFEETTFMLGIGILIGFISTLVIFVIYKFVVRWYEERKRLKR